MNESRAARPTEATLAAKSNSPRSEPASSGSISAASSAAAAGAGGQDSNRVDGNTAGQASGSTPAVSGSAGGTSAGGLSGVGAAAGAAAQASLGPGSGPGEAFRFLHASDLMLHQPLSGLAQLPPSWQATLASAAYNAATRVFDAAITERVAFVLLSGNVVDLDYGGPRAIAFLLGQFERLAQRGIQVYWCGGAVDHLERWPTAIELPENVRTFPSTLVDTAVVRRNGKVLATIHAAAHDPHRSSMKEFQATAGGGLPIGLTHGNVAANQMAGLGLRYWALGGRMQRQVQIKSGVAEVYPGSPQGRDGSAVGPHGAVLVSCEADGQLRTQLVECDGVRWMDLGLTVAESTSQDALKDVLAERALQVTSKWPDLHLLVRWQIGTTGDYSADFRRQENKDKLLKWLRNEFASSPGLWSVDLNFSAPRNLPKGWQEEDTILGDFLREVSRYRSDPQLPLSVVAYAGTQDELDGGHRLTRMDPANREALLDAVLLDGIDRLGGNQA